MPCLLLTKAPPHEGLAFVKMYNLPMSQRKGTFAVGEYYHIYNRGNSRQTIFTTESEYRRFQYLLYVANGTAQLDFRSIEQDKVLSFERGQPFVAIGAYCLMPNHFHILLTPVVENGVQQFMQKISTSYSMYFNKRHNRSGSLFEGKFKSEYVGEDRYMKYLFSYIHLNPIKLIQSDWKETGIRDLEAAQKYLEEYKYSSFIDFQHEREESALLNRALFPDYFKTKKEFDTELLDWLNYNQIDRK